MSYEFRICNEIDNNFEYYYEINNHLILNFNTQNHMTEFSNNKVCVVCLGYCFDIRNPERSVKNTLSTLLEVENFENNIKYLNGHYIILHIKENQVSLYTDASSLTPVYFSENLKVVSNYLDERENLFPLNPNYKLNLNTYDVTRFNLLNTYDDVESEKLSEYYISLLKNQHQFFKDKNLNLTFQADNYHKALFALLSPILPDQNILVRKMDEKGFNKKFGEAFSKEFSMNYYEIQEGEDEYPLVDGLNILARNNMSNYKAVYSNDNNKINDEKLIDLYSDEQGDENQLNYEYNLIDNYYKSNKNDSEDFLLYEPLNSRELLNVFIELNKRGFLNSNVHIIGEFKPSLNFYNFTNGQTLRELNFDLKKENEELKSNSISSQNQKFLLNVKLSDFKVSQNLDGKLKNREIIVYPAKQKIKKDVEHTIQYKSDEEGLIYIEGFYKNQKNAKRIEITVDDEHYNIFDFYGGRYFFFDGEINISFKYTQSYDHLSWQKAGTLRVKKVT